MWGGRLGLHNPFVEGSTTLVLLHLSLPLLMDHFRPRDSFKALHSMHSSSTALDSQDSSFKALDSLDCTPFMVLRDSFKALPRRPPTIPSVTAPLQPPSHVTATQRPCNRHGSFKAPPPRALRPRLDGLRD